MRLKCQILRQGFFWFALLLICFFRLFDLCYKGKHNYLEIKSMGLLFQINVHRIKVFCNTVELQVAAQQTYMKC